MEAPNEQIGCFVSDHISFLGDGDRVLTTLIVTDPSAIWYVLIAQLTNPFPVPVEEEIAIFCEARGFTNQCKSPEQFIGVIKCIFCKKPGPSRKMPYILDVYVLVIYPRFVEIKSFVRSIHRATIHHYMMRH